MIAKNIPLYVVTLHNKGSKEWIVQTTDCEMATKRFYALKETITEGFVRYHHFENGFRVLEISAPAKRVS